MLALERRKLILQKLQEEKRVVVGDLSREFGVSEETIRRDLDRMDSEGTVVKSYGGAVLNESDKIDMPFNMRKKFNVDGKQKVAALVAEMVEDGDHITLDASTTAVFIAKALRRKQRLTVVTNSVEILVELSDVPGWNLISAGGSLKEGYLALVGPSTAENLRQYRVEKAIISCKGIDRARGLMDGSEEFCQAKREMLHSAQTRILAVDRTKFSRTAFCRIADLSEINIVVTDGQPDGEWLQEFGRLGIRCVWPGGEN